MVNVCSLIESIDTKYKIQQFVVPSHRLVTRPLPRPLLFYPIGPKESWLRAQCRRWRNESPWSPTAPSASYLEDLEQLKGKKNK